MLDLNQFEKLRENNMLEVNQALTGIPSSVWDTYSAFSNSYGGTILLGVKETKDKHLLTCGLTENQANKLLKEFWDVVNNNTKISINLLSDKDVQIHQINSDYIIVINIPQADKSYKPVFINNNPLIAFRRNHEGDYSCTKKEIRAMLRDQDEKSNDSYLIEDMDLSVINQDTLNKYRMSYRQHHKEEHPFGEEETDQFLIHIGAAKRDSKGITRPTRAGLLMFGNFYDITSVYPNYFLDYQDHRNLEGDDMRWSFRITSNYGDWSGNLYDFFYRIAFKLTEDIAVPFKMNGIYRDDSSPMKKAIREALCNTLSNADYHGDLGLVIKQYHDRIVFSNPGTLAIPLEQALAGGESQARNKTILNMFSFVNIGERAGSGIPLILKTTRDGNYPEPIIFDKFNPDVTKLTVFIKKGQPQYETSVTNNHQLNDSEQILGYGMKILGNEAKILGNDTEILGNNINIDRLIDELKLKRDAKDNLKLLYNNFKDSVFGNIDIQDSLKINKNTATSYIKILKDHNLIEPVTGKGKGKYIFKK